MHLFNMYDYSNNNYNIRVTWQIENEFYFHA